MNKICLFFTVSRVFFRRKMLMEEFGSDTDDDDYVPEGKDYS